MRVAFLSSYTKTALILSVNPAYILFEQDTVVLVHVHPLADKVLGEDAGAQAGLQVPVGPPLNALHVELDPGNLFELVKVPEIIKTRSNKEKSHSVNSQILVGFDIFTSSSGMNT